MNSPIGMFFGGAVAIILLVLFACSTFYMASFVLEHCKTGVECGSPSTAIIGDGFVYVVTTVSGLVSALVIAQLSVTEPGKAPSVGSFTPDSQRSEKTVTTVVGLYLFVWIVTGLTALVVGVMLYPKVLQTLSDIGTTWLGLAVSAAYAYFGISPTRSRASEWSDERYDVLFSDEIKLGQKIPNVSETSICGAIKSKIKRSDAEFAKLIKSQNIKIEFKNEEGTEADRMMTKRLSEKLDGLADLVEREWPGTKLRVTEAWDEDDEHSPGALHYEGRAADLTTSPIDGAKLGRLGRLAVEAGFDWVYFEDTSHIHVSVKS